MHNNKKLNRAKPRWYRAGLGSTMLNMLGRHRDWSCLLRLPAVRAARICARNLEASSTLAKFLRAHSDVIDGIMQYVE